ncbi:lantibiotic dehydratase [Yimella sp. cx-573]|nr:lantibiotic dehydratase [Yimella sp. cx-573]
MSIDTTTQLTPRTPSAIEVPEHGLAPALTPRLAPLTFVRVAGLSTDACTMSSIRTRNLLDEIALGELRVETGQEAVEDILFELVPTVTDIDLRRGVLAAKRAVHRGRPLSPELLTTLTDLLPPSALEVVTRWSAAAEHTAALTTALSEAVDDDTSDAVVRLSLALSNESFHRSLALAAPDWLRHGKPHRKPRERRNLRTLLSYVSRSAVKTSPFSALTTVGIAGGRSGESPGDDVAVSYASTALAHLAARSYARDESVADRLRYRVSPVRPGGPESPSGIVLLAEAEADGGLAWRLDRICEAEHVLPWVGAAHGGDLPLAQLLAGLGGADPFRRFRRLFDSGLITLVAPWQRGGDPLTAVAELVARDEHPIAEQVHDVLDRTTALASADVRTRTDVGVHVRSIAAQWAPSAGLDRFDPGELVYEDVRTTEHVADPAEHPMVREQLDLLGRLSRPYVFRSHLYDVLVDAMVEQFGPGGRTADVPGFLMRLALDSDNMPALDRASMADQEIRGTISERAILPVGRTSSPPTMAALYQVAAADSAAIADGRFTLVVNQFNPGAGGLLARFSGLLGDDLRQPLREHIRACWPDTHVRELVLWTELNTAQSRSAGLIPALTTSSEVADTTPLDLAQVHLVHDAHNGTVELRDASTDQPVGLPYLGLVPPHMFPPYARLLAVLADPWINGSPYSDYVLPYALRAERQDEVVHIARRQYGRLLCGRQAWVVPTDLLPLPEQGESDVDLVRRVDAFRRRYQLPTEVFVHQLAPASGTAGSTDRKPMWIDLSAPTCVNALACWLDAATEHVRLVEAFPTREAGPHGHPHRNREGRTVTTEYVNLMRWDRPEEQQ